MQVNDILHDPSRWQCEETGTTDDLWICLACSKVVSGGRGEKDTPGAEHAALKGHMAYMKLNGEEDARIWDRAGKTHRAHRALGMIGCEGDAFRRTDQVSLLRTTSMRVQSLECDDGPHNLSLTRSGSTLRSPVASPTANAGSSISMPLSSLKRSRSFLNVTPKKQLNKHEREDKLANVLAMWKTHRMVAAFQLWVGEIKTGDKPKKGKKRKNAWVKV